MKYLWCLWDTLRALKPKMCILLTLGKCFKSHNTARLWSLYTQTHILRPHENYLCGGTDSNLWLLTNCKYWLAVPHWRNEILRVHPSDIGLGNMAWKSVGLRASMCTHTHIQQTLDICRDSRNVISVLSNRWCHNCCCIYFEILQSHY